MREEEEEEGERESERERQRETVGLTIIKCFCSAWD